MTDVNELIRWIPTLATIIAMYFAIKGGKRTDIEKTSETAKQYATFETKLGMVLQVVTDINSKFDSQQRQINDLSERVVRVEESNKSAHNRVDRLDKIIDKIDGGNKNE